MLFFSASTASLRASSRPRRSWVSKSFAFIIEFKCHSWGMVCQAVTTPSGTVFTMQVILCGNVRIFRNVEDYPKIKLITTISYTWLSWAVEIIGQFIQKCSLTKITRYGMTCLLTYSAVPLIASKKKKYFQTLYNVLANVPTVSMLANYNCHVWFVIS